jgi:ADP-heptose:LPS heptosyltransferase
MTKDIAIFVSAKGIGDIIFHHSFIKSIYNHHKKKIILFVNKSTKADLIFKKNRYIKKVVLIDLRRPNKIFYLSKIINIAIKLHKFNFEKIYYTGNHRWHKFSFNILSIFKQFRLISFKKDKKLIIPFLESYLKKINITYYSDFNVDVKENVSKNFKKKISRRKKLWAFLSIDTSEDQIKIPNTFLIRIIEILKKKYNTIFINTNKQNSHKLNFFNDKNIINTSSLNIIEIFYIIKRSEVYIGNESGPSNIAAINNKKCFIFVNKKVLIESSKLPMANKRKYFDIDKIIKNQKQLLKLI